MGIKASDSEVGRDVAAETMEPDRLNDEVLSRVEINRRELVRRLVIGTAFAVPMLSSFDMAALTTSSANALTPNQLGFGGGNQTVGAPTITSAAAATFIAGHHGSFDVTSTGGPDPSITLAGQLPNGVSLVDTGGGVGLLSGTPGARSGGVYGLELSAANGLPPPAAQTFRLTVDEAPAITSRASESFAAGVPGSLLLTAVGFPVPSIGLSGRLPHGLSFVANPGEATAIIFGAPTSKAIGKHKLTVTASNGVSPPASQTLTLTIRRVRTRVDNRLTVTGAHIGRDGKAAFLATVHAAGTITAVVTAHGHGVVAESHGNVSRPGGARFHVAPNAAGHRLFRSAPASLELALAVMFKPSVGSPRTIRLHGLRLP